jgi:hypothetical protein
MRGEHRVHRKDRFSGAVAAVVLSVLLLPVRSAGAGQERIAAAKSLRCSFPLTAVSEWKKAAPPAATVKPATLVLVFESIDTDEGTARLKSGSVGTEVTARRSGGYLHLIQSFRSGALYTTTVFDKDGPNGAIGKLKAVHSRHEYFTVTVPGATSSPEQYYGECEVTN